MEAPSSPGDRPESLGRKVTYLERKKRKRVISNPTIDSDSDSSSAPPSVKSPSKSPMKTPATAKKTGPKTPASKGPKKVDVDLPGPSPVKRTRRDSNESVKSSKPTKSRVRNAPSTVSLKQTAQEVADSTSVTNKSDLTKPESDTPTKPESTITATPKPKARAKSIAAEEDFDDNASVADSIISVTRTRRNETERIEYYKNQPECGTLEPHSVQCTRCNKKVNLGRKQTYAVRPWEIHRARCDQKQAQVVQPIHDNSAVQPPATPTVAVVDAVLASSSKPISTPARRPSEDDRKSFLESEKQVKELEKNRALCAKCDQWIALSEANSYASGNWIKHKTKCFDAVPSNRVAAAKRKLLLVNDRQVKSFASNTVDCNNCGVSITLEGEGDFNLTAWDAHKVQCTKSVPIPRSESISGTPFPSRSSRPPASSGSASTSDTIIAEAGSSRQSQGVKRSREELDAVAEEESRSAARPRTATYLAPQIEPPNTLLGWFMLPFSSIARGFKESLKDRS